MRFWSWTVAVSLLCANPTLVASLPWSSDNPQSPPSPDSDRRSSWRRLSDSIIQKIWSYPDPKSYHWRNGAPAPSGLNRSLNRYRGHTVLRFNISSAAEAQQLSQRCNQLFMDIWDFNENWVDVHLDRERIPHLLMNLPESLQNAYTPLLREHDLTQAIADSYLPRNPSSDDDRADGRRGVFARFQNVLAPQQSDLFFRDYQPLSAISNWMRLMVSLFPSIAELITVGNTYEGRPIQGIRLSADPSDPDDRTLPRQTILITGGSHAREWVSVSSVTYIAYSIMTEYAFRRSSAGSLLDSFDFVFVPTLNPDGYIYTWEYDRLWRKSRQPTPLVFCKGLDLDRSYGYKWDAGSSRGNPCSESFAGENAFDSVEAGSFATWARNETDRNRVEWVGFVDLHSYSQLVLYPYSYSCSEEPPSLENLEEVAWGLTKAIRHANGGKSAVYGAAPACEGNVAQSGGKKVVLPRMETGGGSALDWFYHELGVRYAYQIKLRDTGSYGFLLPRDYIVPVGKEALDAVVYLGKFLAGEWD